MEDIDLSANVAISSLQTPFIPDNSEESLQKFIASKRLFHFKFQPGPSDNGFVYVTSRDISRINNKTKLSSFPADFRLEPINLPNSLTNINNNYLTYLNDLFEIYNALDNYKYPISLSEIGLKNSNREAKINQENILYSAIDSIINSLELLLNKEVDEDSVRQKEKTAFKQQKQDSSDDTSMEQDSIDEEQFNQQAFDWKDFLNVLMFIKTFFFSNELNLPHNCSVWVNKSDLSNPPTELLEEILLLDNPYEYDLFYSYVNQLLIRGLFEQALNILINTDINDKSGNTNDYDNTNSFLAGSSTNGANQTKKSDFLQYIHDCLIKCINDYAEIHDSAAGYAEEQASQSSNTDLSSMVYRVEYLRQDYKTFVLLIINKINDHISANNASLGNDERTMLLQFRTSLLLLSGSKSVILSQASTWYEALCGFILFDLPNFKLVNDYLDAIKNKFDINYMNIWEVICFDLLGKNNFLKALKSLESLSNDSVAYLAVLLEAKGYLNDYNRIDYLNDDENNFGGFPGNAADRLLDEILLDNQENKLTISQYLLYVHAFKCFSNKELVPNAIGILRTLHLKNFKEILTSYLPYNFYCDNNDDSEWLLGICAENQLLELSSNIYKLIGLNYYENGLYFESLTTLMKCADYTTILKIVWELFNQKLIAKYKDDFSEILMIDLIINKGEDYDIDDDVLTEFQKMQILQCEIDPFLKRLLAPYQQLLKFLNGDADMDFRSSKQYLVKLIKFQYLPSEILVILLLFLLKYFNLSVVDDNDAEFDGNDSVDAKKNVEGSSVDLKIGISLFEISELINIIEILNLLESSQVSHKFEGLNSSYLEYLTEVDYNMKAEYKKYEVEIPEDLKSLIRQLREKISFEISRKYLE